MPNLYIIAGPNGAGKTTASYTILPETLNCYEFVNADEIARGISPLKPEKASFEAGKLMLTQVKKHIELGLDFAIETTLSTRTYADLVENAQRKGYTVTLLFFWLVSFEVAKTRVAKRVEEGGHNIPNDVIERRYKRGLFNLFNVFLPLCNGCMLIDNNFETKSIAQNLNGNEKIFEKEKFECIKTEAKKYEY